MICSRTLGLVSLSIILVLMIVCSLTQPLMHRVLGETTVLPVSTGNESTGWKWTLLDTVNTSKNYIDVVREKILRDEVLLGGWYTDTVAVDPESNTVVVAWARLNATRRKNDYVDDYVYVAFLKLVDADGDGEPESIQKNIKSIRIINLEGLDSITIGEIDGEKFVLVTWTFYRGKKQKNDVGGAVFTIDGKLVWQSDIADTQYYDKYYDEYSRSCYVPAYNNGEGGFLIVWRTYYKYGNYTVVKGRWLYRSGGSWSLTPIFNISDTHYLHYNRSAGQMLCIGGSEKALVVYRKRYSEEDKPEVYGALVSPDNNVTEIGKLWNSSSVEEVIGVRGAYTSGYFIVPLVLGNNAGYGNVNYIIIDETSGGVVKHGNVTKNGTHPYAIALEDKFVLAWIDYDDDGDGDGEPKIAIINPDSQSNPEYEVQITGEDDCIDKHPIITSYTDNGKHMILYVWSSSVDGNDYDIKYAIVELGGEPQVINIGTLVSGIGDQRAHGLGVLGADKFIVVYTDTDANGVKEDLLAHVKLPDVEEVDDIRIYKLPGEASLFKDHIRGLISNATSSIYIAVSFWDEGGDPCSNPDTIAYTLVQKKKQENTNIDIRVILDDSMRNNVVKACLEDNGIQVEDDSKSIREHIMHNKFIVVDGEYVVVSTANFIVEDLGYNNNTAIVIRSKAIAYFYEKEFMQLWRKFSDDQEKEHDYSFTVFIKYGGKEIVVEGYFSPVARGMIDKIPRVLYGYLTRAGNEICFASYIFTRSRTVEPVREALVYAVDKGVTVIGVFDEELNVDTPWSILYLLVDSGLRVAIDNHQYKMHAKLFVVDNKIAVLGSWNPTKRSTVLHDENVLVIRDPDTENGLARQLSEYIKSMYESFIKFEERPYRYKPCHPVISRVMFKPDDSGSPLYEWVEIVNPTSVDIDLSNYIIGDAENFTGVDDEGLYRFPEGSVLRANSSIIVAYNATAFYEVYGFYPDYEIVDSNQSIPDLEKFMPEKFTGEWDLDDDGDEVLLAIVDNWFIRVVDALWYGDSTYITGSRSGKPLDILGWKEGYGIVNKGWKDGLWDALSMDDKYELVYLWNKPAKVEIHLKNYIITISVIDPDSRDTEIARVLLSSEAHELTLPDTSKIDLLKLDLYRGNYSISVIYREEYGDEVFYGGREGGFRYTPNLVLVVYRDGERRIYALSYTRLHIGYWELNTTHHKIEILVIGGKQGFINVTIPRSWRSIEEVLLNGRPMARDREWGIVDDTLWIDPSGNDNVTIVGFIGGQVQARAGAGALGGVAEDYLETLLVYLAIAIVVSLILGLGLGYTKNKSSHGGAN